MLLALIALPLASVHVYPTDSIDNALKQLKAQGGGELHLHGTFRLQNPVRIEGFKNLTVFGHNATLSGGVVIPTSAWQRTRFLGNDVYRAPIRGSTAAHEAWFGSQRLTRPTLPKAGYWIFGGFLDGSEKAEWNKGQTRMSVAQDTVADWHNLKDVELVAHHFWVTSRLPIQSLADGVVEFSKPSVFKLADDYTGGPAPFRAENVAEALNGKNEFYIDSTEHAIYVSAATWPKKAGELILPQASQVLQIRNSERVTVRNVAFANTEWLYTDAVSGDVQAAFSVPGAVEIDSSTNCTLDHCQFRNLGTYGLEVKGASARTMVRDSDMSDLGAGGVKIGTGSSHSTVENCVITGGGRLHAPAIGVYIGDSGYNRVDRNLISDFFYTGVSLGWVWGYGPSQGIHNVIEENVIHTIGQGELSDMGAIYNLGVSPGTVIRRNLIANVKSRGYGGWGIYLDEGSSSVLVEQNAVFDVQTGTFHQHYGKDNVITHNLLCGARRDGQIIRSRHEDHTSFALRENVILWEGTPLFGGSPAGGGLVSERNLLARFDGAEDIPAFDAGSQALSPTHASSVDGWLGSRPGSSAWWRQFGPSRGNWRKAVEPFAKPWVDRLNQRLNQ